MAVPTQQDLLDSLGATAEATLQAWLAAQTNNPGSPDTNQLYLAEVTARNIYLDALNKTFNNDPAVTSVQNNLDAITRSIQSEINTIHNIDTWVTLVGQAVQLATTVASFFA
jgi:hypothetical protein